MTLLRMPLIEMLDDHGVSAIADEWKELRRESSATSVFTTWAWTKAWLDTEGAGADLVVAVARDPESGQLVGIAPFYVADTKRGGIAVRELRLLGSGRGAPDHLDLIIRADALPEVAEALWTAVSSARSWHTTNLDGVVAGGHLARVAVRRRDDVSTEMPCPYLPLVGGWDVVAARFSSNLRKNLERYGRKLDRDAEVTERMVTNKEDLDDTFDHLIRLHQAVRTANGDPGVFARPEMERFLRTAAHNFLDAGRLRLWRLDVSGTPIAVIMCIRSGASVVFYTTGYDVTWKKYAPGRRIMARAIRAAIDEGAAQFDFLRGDEPYKREWGTEIRHDLVIRHPASPLGRVLAIAARAVRFSRRVLRRSA
jgi:CelD/BcsL family acetyltransferase involved in cellulose biosynthesis